MGMNHLTDVEKGHVFAPQTLKGIHQVLLTNVACVIHIELLEKLPKHFLRQCLLNLECRSQELRIVDLSITNVINFSDDLIDLTICHADRQVLHSEGKLVSIDKTASIEIYPLEL